MTVLGLGSGDELLCGNSEAASDFLADAATREQEVILVSRADTQDKVDEIAKHRAKEPEARKKKVLYL